MRLSFFFGENLGLFFIFSKFLTVSGEKGLCSYKKTKINKNISEFLFLIISENSLKSKLSLSPKIISNFSCNSFCDFNLSYFVYFFFFYK